MNNFKTTIKVRFEFYFNGVDFCNHLFRYCFYWIINNHGNLRDPLLNILNDSSSFVDTLSYVQYVLVLFAHMIFCFLNYAPRTRCCREESSKTYRWPVLLNKTASSCSSSSSRQTVTVLPILPWLLLPRTDFFNFTSSSIR